MDGLHMQLLLITGRPINCGSPEHTATIAFCMYLDICQVSVICLHLQRDENRKQMTMLSTCNIERE